jgi:glycosyltransferase involved in cell wall biosynthesis
MTKQGVCVVIPVYNSEKTIAAVINSVLDYTDDVIVVNDGSTDGTTDILLSYGDTILPVSYPTNKGKGYALKQGFRQARQRGFSYALTLDADGQHSAEDIAAFMEVLMEHPHTFITGVRSFDHPNMSKGSVFANKFSNFWFTLQTARRLPDTQSGYRLYPLDSMKRMLPITCRYEAELELLVRCAWRGIPILTVPIQVHYPTRENRISHFRPKEDFLRISILNTVLCLLAILYGYPSMIIRKLIEN